MCGCARRDEMVYRKHERELKRVGVHCWAAEQVNVYEQ